VEPRAPRQRNEESKDEDDEEIDPIRKPT